MATSLAPRRTVRALLENAIDYAGLFPPAGLPMAEVVRRFAEYRAGADAWALGRLVVPATQLAELGELAEPLLPRAAATNGAAATPWHVSALLGTDIDVELALVAAFNDGHRRDSARGHAVVDTVELRAADAIEAAERLERLPEWLHAFVEVPATVELEPVLAALRPHGAGAKLRTGGVTADVFPGAEQVARFLAASARAGMPCKLTAGLHHALTGEYALTYAAGSPRAGMFGFVPVLLAGALLRQGLGEAEAAVLLAERDAAQLHFADDVVRWRDRRVSLDELAAARTTLVASFGSCSFEEPLQELRALGWL